MPQPEVRPEVVDVLAADSPLDAFFAADARGAVVALRTSGTSGGARTVVRTTRSWVESFPHVSALTGLDATSRVWVPGPMAASMNLFAATHATWAGAALVDSLDDASHAQLTPTSLRRALADRPEALASVHVTVAGDGLDHATYEAALAARARVSHYYGAAELSFVAWGDHADTLRPFPGVEVAARDGELWARSPYLCEGYLETDRELRRDDDGWMTVGDRGAVTPDRSGDVVRVHGRDGGITTAGATVLVADVERVLRANAAGALMVVGLPHDDLGQVVAAAVTDPEDVRHLPGVARRELAPEQRPRRWVVLDALPTTDAGKPDRAAVVAALTERAGP
jgi:long-chain acyl-CoA synthetase